jgi:polyisoprenoid-binding protein YceI
MKLFLGMLATVFAWQAQASTPVDLTASRLEWVGKKVGGQHNGTINLKEGSVSFNDKGVVTGGVFTFDMKTIDTKDLTGEWKTKLDSHLKSADFFNVDLHQTSRFELTKVTPKGGDNYEFTGKLTIKDKSETLTFPGRIVKEGGKHRATANFAIDRTKWDIRYNSKKYFDVKKLGDKLILDDIDFKLDVQTAEAKPEEKKPVDTKKATDKKG